MTDQTAELEWRDTGAGVVPVSTQFDDPYFSLDDGLAETQHVFLAGNGFPGRFWNGIHIAELGFGTGLNFLATLHAFRDAKCGGVLRFTSFEAYPMATPDLQKALSHYPDLPTSILEAGIESRVSGPDFELEVIIGDARLTLLETDVAADAWFLDGFSPAKNPELWGAELMQSVAEHTRAGGTFATYTAAGFVRSALADAGFEVQRVPGFGRKRHMTIGTLADAE